MIDRNNFKALITNKKQISLNSYTICIMTKPFQHLSLLSYFQQYQNYYSHLLTDYNKTCTLHTSPTSSEIIFSIFLPEKCLSHAPFSDVFVTIRRKPFNSKRLRFLQSMVHVVFTFFSDKESFTPVNII